MNSRKSRHPNSFPSRPRRYRHGLPRWHAAQVVTIRVLFAQDDLSHGVGQVLQTKIGDGRFAVDAVHRAGREVQLEDELVEIGFLEDVERFGPGAGGHETDFTVDNF